MEKLLEMAAKVADQAEVYLYEKSSNRTDFKNAALHDIRSEISSGYSLRLIKDNKLGFAYTRNLISREELIQNALDSLGGGVEAAYELPLTTDLPALNTYDDSIEDVTSTQLVDHCDKLCRIMKSRTSGEIGGGSQRNMLKIRVANSKGTDLTIRNSLYEEWVHIVFPGSANGIMCVHSDKVFGITPDKKVDEAVELFNAAEKVVEPEGGRMMVMFMPGSLVTLSWRFNSGTSAKSVFEKISPLAEKVGEQVFSEKLTILNHPQDDTLPGARPFDDEGTANSKFYLFEKGVLKGFYNNLDYAKKLGVEPNGHGYRSAMWGGDPLSMKPMPAVPSLRIEPGDKSFKELVGMMDRGIILYGALGPHSGNIPNGDYSVGVSPGLYVEGGEIVGRVKDAMVAGNVYETLKEVVDVGDTCEDGWGGYFPPVLCDNVSVACKE